MFAPAPASCKQRIQFFGERNGVSVFQLDHHRQTDGRRAIQRINQLVEEVKRLFRLAEHDQSVGFRERFNAIDTGNDLCDIGSLPPGAGASSAWRTRSASGPAEAKHFAQRIANHQRIGVLQVIDLRRAVRSREIPFLFDQRRSGR
jgi:hypothetical protein